MGTLYRFSTQRASASGVSGELKNGKASPIKSAKGFDLEG
jgi:hypothetical protein